MRDLMWWQLWQRSWSQYFMFVAQYQEKVGRPGDMEHLPPAVLRVVMWPFSIIPAVGDHYGRWLANDGATVKVRPVNRGHAMAAWILVLPVSVSLFVGTLVGSLTAGVPAVVAVTLGAVALPAAASGFYMVIFAWQQGRVFNTKIDIWSSDLVRDYTCRAGSGLELLDDLQAWAETEDLIIGGVAVNMELRNDYYLPNGWVVDCGHDPSTCTDDDCLRTLYIPASRLNQPDRKV